jgi:hypothetical protein
MEDDAERGWKWDSEKEKKKTRGQFWNYGDLRTRGRKYKGEWDHEVYRREGVCEVG